MKQALKASPASHLVLEKILKKEDQSVGYHFHTEDLRLFLWTLKNGLVTSGGWATQLENTIIEYRMWWILPKSGVENAEDIYETTLDISLLIPVASDSFLNLSNIHPDKQKPFWRNPLESLGHVTIPFLSPSPLSFFSAANFTVAEVADSLYPRKSTLEQQRKSRPVSWSEFMRDVHPFQTIRTQRIYGKTNSQ